MTDTAFGPADHPDLPLGLRRHPRFAARILLPVGPGLDLVSIYSHDKEHLDAVVMRLWQPADHVQREHWDDDKKEWVYD